MRFSTILSGGFYGLSFFFFPAGLWLLYEGRAVAVMWEVTSLGSIPFSAHFMFDSFSLLLVGCLFLIAGSVVAFSEGYFGEEPHSHRFHLLVAAFVLSMFIFVFSGSLVGLLLGWDGLGVISYLLVLYYPASRSVSASLSVALTNRLGDVGLLLGLGWLVTEAHWQQDLAGMSGPVLFGIVLAGLTKSAQYPFSTWLPLAMAAPTPVSALVHSSTLVTAGVYLMVRVSVSWAVESWAQTLFLCLGCLTMVAAGFSALVEMDVKKVVALSTLSQLGLMFVALGLGSPVLAFFHLLAHAMFKALLFLCVGVFIHYHGHSQDLRGMGHLAATLPLSQSAASLAHLALGGFPWLTAFYSKEPIFEGSFHSASGSFLPLMVVVGFALTSAYSMRASLLSQFLPPVASGVVMSHDESWLFRLPILALATGAVVWGATLHWLMLTPGSWVSGSSSCFLGLFASVLGAGFLLSPGTRRWRDGLGAQREVCVWVGSFGFLSISSGAGLVGGPLRLGAEVLAHVDQGWLEWVGGRGLESSWQWVSGQVSRGGSKGPVPAVLTFGAVLVCIGVVGGW